MKKIFRKIDRLKNRKKFKRNHILAYLLANSLPIYPIYLGNVKINSYVEIDSDNWTWKLNTVGFPTIIDVIDEEKI